MGHQTMNNTPDNSVIEYLLKELEFQVGIESKARDRVEQMVNYFLTTIAAIIGAVLLVTELKSNALLVVFLAVFLLLIFGISVFYRFCRLRRIITHTKLNRYRIRLEIEKIGIKQAEVMQDIEGDPTGFSYRMSRNIVMLAIICGCLGAAVFVLGIALAPTTLESMATISVNQFMFYALAAIVGFSITIIPLLIILRNYWNDAKQLVNAIMLVDESM